MIFLSKYRAGSAQEVDGKREGRRRCSGREQKVQGKGRQQGRQQLCYAPFERNSQLIHGIRRVIGRERVIQLRIRRGRQG